MKVAAMPSPFILYFHAIVAVFYSKSGTSKTPLVVGKYILQSKIIKHQDYDYYGVGVYIYRKQKVFIKTWTGNRKDMRYYGLVSQYIFAQILEGVMKRQKKITIHFPKVLAIVETQKQLSVIFEYIEGVNLKTFTVKKQSQAIRTVINDLTSLSQDLTLAEKKYFQTRSILFYSCLLPVFTGILLFTASRHRKDVIRAFLKCIHYFPEIWNAKLVLAHRDLYPENIIMDNGTIYLLDTENMALTLPGYDYAYISASSVSVSLSHTLAKEMSQVSDFLKLFISLHLAAASFSMPHVKEDHLMWLHEQL